MMKGVNNYMPAQWTAEVIGEMHMHGITAKQLAEQIGWHPKYLSTVLNGHRTPTGAEERCRAALNALVSQQNQYST